MSRQRGVWLSVSWLILLYLASWLIPLALPADPFQPVAEPLLTPRAHPPFGTDALGRDFLSRLIYAVRMTLNAGMLAAAITILSGITLALIAALSKSWFDQILMGILNAALAIPGLLFALLLTASMGPGFRTVILAIGFGLVPGYARLARAMFLQVRGAEYIDAARSLGSKPARIAIVHLLPNALSGVAASSALHFSWAIMGITTLTFLGLSGDPSIPELGALLDAGRQYLQIAPHLALLPGSILSLTILAIFRVSEALQ